MIPRRIFTIWLNEDPKLPELVERCLESQKSTGYEHRLITLENCFKDNRYLKECSVAKKWAKACDYLRIHYLYTEGGVYLDADVLMEPGKNFDQYLQEKMFCGREKNQYVSNAIIGAESGHPILEKYLKTVEENFIGSGDMVFQPGMFLWTELVTFNPVGEVTILPPPVFLPFDHQTGITEKNGETVCTHLFSKSWLAT